MVYFVTLWSSIVIQYRWLVIIFSLGIAALAPLAFDRLYFDNSPEIYFLNDDPNLIAFQTLIDEFGDPEYLLIGIETKLEGQDVFDPDIFLIVSAISEFLQNHKYVTKVSSLSNYQYSRSKDDVLTIRDLVDTSEALTFDKSIFNDARSIMMDEILPIGRIITQDLQHTRIIARTVYRPGKTEHKVKLITDLNNFIEKNNLSEKGYEFRISGAPLISERFQTLTKNDLIWINPLIVLIMLSILIFYFRSLLASFLPWSVIGVSVLVVFSFQGLMQWPFTSVNTALLPTIIIIGLGASVHVLLEFFYHRKRHDSKRASRETIETLFKPVLFTAITTTTGFIALAITDLVPVRQYAVLAGFAPMVIFIVSMTTFPALLSFVSMVPSSCDCKVEQVKGGTWIHAMLSQVPSFTFKYQNQILFLGLLILLFCSFSLAYVKVDSNVLNYFKSNSIVNNDLNYFDQHYKGISNLEFIFDSGKADGIMEPAFLQRVEDFEDYVEALPVTGKPRSILDYLRQTNQSLNNDDSIYFKLPTTRELIAQLMLVYELSAPTEDLSDLKDIYGRYVRVSVPVINLDTSEMTDLIRSMKENIRYKFSDVKIQLTGPSVLMNARENYINSGMIKSFAIALCVISICFFGLFGSVKYGLIALIPSVTPILLTAGFTAVIGVNIDLGTMIVGAMTIGIAVDDSIHVLSRYVLCREKGLRVYDSIERTINQAGRAVVLTSIVLVSGFSSLLFGSFIPYIYTGLFSAIIMALALVGDLIFLPAILFKLEKEDSQGYVIQTLPKE